MARQLIYQFDLGGRVYTLNFGMYCWEVFCEKMGIGPDNLLSAFQGATSFKAMRLIFYCGVIANDYINNQPDSITEQEAAKVLNDDPEMMNTIFNSAMTVFYGEAEEPKTDQKKSPSRSKKSKK